MEFYDHKDKCPFCGGMLFINTEEKVIYCSECEQKGHTVKIKYDKDPKEAYDYVNARRGENILIEQIQDVYGYVKQLGIDADYLEDIAAASESELPSNGWIVTEEAVPMPCDVPHSNIYSQLITDKSIDITDRQLVCNILHCINVTYLLKILDIYIPERYNAKQKDVLMKICLKYPKDTKVEIEYTSNSSGKAFKVCEDISEFLLFLDTI